MFNGSGFVNVGLVNGNGKYLTAEYYGNSVSTAGSRLGKKQIWKVIVKDYSDRQALVEVKGPHGLYLVVDKDGLVRCGTLDSKHHGLFLLKFHVSGKWSLRSMSTNGYLEWDGEDALCLYSTLCQEHLWIPHIAIHVHVVLYNIRNQCYGQFDPATGRVCFDAPIPYSMYCGYILRFKNGRYHLETADHHYVSCKEELTHYPSLNTALTMHLRPGYRVAFQNSQRSMLYPQGMTRTLRPGPHPIDEQEWFIIQRCPTWVSLKIKAGKYISVTYERDIYANFKEITPQCLFLFEVDENTGRVRLKTSNGKYIIQEGRSSILANGKGTEKECGFNAEWRLGRVSFQAINGRYLRVKPIGVITASALKPGLNEEFTLRLANRSFLILQCKYGYVASFSNSDTLQCNREEPDYITLIPCKQGFYHFRGQNGKFWSITPDSTFLVNGDDPLNFCIEIQRNNLLAILAPNGHYLRCDHSGILVADATQIHSECLFEF
uniref:Fascin n=2 Tax=Latimeria chalumnae TaxID=7897 RepID=H3ATM8_LATCH|nr:PREDICTED: fascin-3 [Latimeria chalumnae]|eukprot:XP_014348922.1 PREDICTED: fascin-3 [Latimeria chalumnae]